MNELTTQYMEMCSENILLSCRIPQYSHCKHEILYLKILDYMGSDKLSPFSLFMSITVLYKTSQQLTEYWGKLCLPTYNMLDW